jgi:hypothetical protein
MASVREMPGRPGRVGVQRHGRFVVTGLEGQATGERICGCGEQDQVLPQTDLVKFKELLARLNDWCELELETDEGSSTDLTVNRPDRLMQTADDVVVKLRDITPDRADRRLCPSRQHQQVSAIASPAAANQFDELSYALRRRSEMTKRV